MELSNEALLLYRTPWSCVNRREDEPKVRLPPIRLAETAPLE